MTSLKMFFLRRYSLDIIAAPYLHSLLRLVFRYRFLSGAEGVSNEFQKAMLAVLKRILVFGVITKDDLGKYFIHC